MRTKKGDSSASDVSASGQSDNANKGKAIANGAAKVFNKIGFKARPSTTRFTVEENSTRFQIVHAPDKSPIDMPLPQFPTTNEEFYAAISQINGQGHLHGEDSPFERTSPSSSSRKGSQQSFDSQSMIPRSIIASMDILLGPNGNDPLVNDRKDSDPPVPAPPVTASGNVRPAYERRVASEGVPPRPLSERPLIKYSSLRARPSPQAHHSSMSTQGAHSALSTPNKRASSIRGGHNRVNSGERVVRRRPRRVPSIDSTDSDDESSGPEASSASSTGDARQKTQDPPVEAKPRKNLIKCYFCKEDCQLGDNLCSKCKSRFQPHEEVFDYSESEYEDIEFEDSPIFSPASEKPRGTSSRTSKRRTARPREKSRGWSEFSPVSHLQQLASRSASTSPTSHVAMELKIVPPTDIKVCTVTSPTRSSSGGDGRSSALHHIQQALRPRVPSCASHSPNPGGQDRDAVRLGKVRSGEIKRVDYPDIIKLKDPSPRKNSKSCQKTTQEEPQRQSADSLKSWFKCYSDGSEKGGGSAWPDGADPPTSGRDSAVPARVSTYDRVTSIYDLYASLDET
ncbi:hypothetical protein KVR01_011204 [Diaporthe batatas]|uniref:uncharacterized protein n=1 Tax=Diaporthe batatas TaxID=748121 RepID=UPI001D054B2C|nr:uncharacterized protein KVR01_011204 [Diaporthe batatas]KAG8158761.1 hypothetical protein KVR01_011204 [Diaporthe batatas]